MVAGVDFKALRERVDILALVKHYGVQLQPSGRGYKALCPFHVGTSLTFYVWPEKKRFKCFDCEASGGVIDFVQRLTQKPTAEAAKLIEAWGMGVDESTAHFHEVMEFAEQYFAECLWDASRGRDARAYLQARGLPEELIRALGLGFAPATANGLTEGLESRGWLDVGVTMGLSCPRTGGRGHYDMFRGRVMFPIRSSEGRTIAFGGRLWGEADGPKYLNSKETPLYKKAQSLYGVDVARGSILERKSVVLCEGYFDAVALHQAGVPHAVALCSTTLGLAQTQLLERLGAEELVLLLDGDEAGRVAVERMAGFLVGSGLTCRVASLPGGEDPDVFIQRAGGAAIRQLVDEAPVLGAYLLASIFPAASAGSFEERAVEMERFAAIARGIPSGIQRLSLLGAAAKHLGIPMAELEAALGLPAAKARADSPGKAPPPEELEAMFGALLLDEPRLLSADAAGAVGALRHAELRTLLAAIQLGVPVERVEREASKSLWQALEKAREKLPYDSGASEGVFVSLLQQLRSLE